MSLYLQNKSTYGAKFGPNVLIIQKNVKYLKVKVLILNFKKYNDVFIQKNIYLNSFFRLNIFRISLL